MDATPETSWTVARAVRELPPDARWEIDAGRLELREPTGFYHGRATLRVAVCLSAHVDALGLGQVVGAETGFHLARVPDTLRAPDAAFISNERLGAVTDPDGFAQVAPDLVVEVLSPSERPAAIRRKVAQYLSLGVRSVWVVDARRRRLEQHLAGEDVRVFGEDDAVEDPSLPGFRRRLADLLPDPWSAGDAE